MYGLYYYYQSKEEYLTPKCEEFIPYTYLYLSRESGVSASPSIQDPFDFFEPGFTICCQLLCEQEPLGQPSISKFLKATNGIQIRLDQGALFSPPPPPLLYGCRDFGGCLFDQKLRVLVLFLWFERDWRPTSRSGYLPEGGGYFWGVKRLAPFWKRYWIKRHAVHPECHLAYLQYLKNGYHIVEVQSPYVQILGIVKQQGIYLIQGNMLRP